MSSITVIGGTGYAGSNVVAEAAARGHTVTSVSRSAPAEPVAGVDYRHGSVDDAAVLTEAIAGADAVVAALSPRGELTGRIGAAYEQVAAAAAAAGARLIVVGGFNSLRPADGEPQFAAALGDEPYAPEARELNDVLAWLRTSAPAGLDWTFISPAAEFGAYNPGPRTGVYRVGDSVALFDADGKSQLSGPDLGVAIVDAIERGEHGAGKHIGVAY